MRQTTGMNADAAHEASGPAQRLRQEPPGRMAPPVLALLLAGALGLLPAAVLAERADRDKEANVTADHSTLDDLHQVQILTGHVLLIKGTMRLGGERIYQSEGVFNLKTPNMFAGSILDLAENTENSNPKVSRQEYQNAMQVFNQMTSTYGNLTRARTAQVSPLGGL